MITNEQQYRLTEEQVAKFEQALEQATTNPDKSLHPLLQQAQVAALQSQLADLRADIAAYEVRGPAKDQIGPIFKIGPILMCLTATQS